MQATARRFPAWLVCGVLALGVAARAHAGWPRPAGGPSASGAPEVLFTFDDGPHETHTAVVLDALSRHGVQAIFFWVGWRISRGKDKDQRLALVRRAVAEGHLVANHTLSHPDLCSIGAGAAAREIDANAQLYADASGLPMSLFRAPYGAHCRRLSRMLDDRGLDHLHWDIDPQEWKDHDSRRTTNYLIKKLKRLDGRAIVILHDTHKVTARALPRVLDWIAEENARRRDRGDRPEIRILSGSDLMVERLDRGALDWAANTAIAAHQRVHAALSRLVP